ncbi:CLUMA_CG008886, isoform A [Clunio marinus]|uniref:CLUMA_CG008886, isoform A n=1 Tax=Clunio marinus TaxID=568069 RepID=A0A1J1I4I5_9DIPT|nr:CLUMA_CG008886, isoform A [Clunio marinus]
MNSFSNCSMKIKLFDCPPVKILAELNNNSLHMNNYHHSHANNYRLLVLFINIPEEPTVTSISKT